LKNSSDLKIKNNGNGLPTRMKRQLDQILEYLSALPAVRAVYLFGSRAKGKALPMSDLDICVITRARTSESVKADIRSFSDDKMDISLFWDLPVAMRYRVLKEGRLLMKRDDGALHSVITGTLREYFDFVPVIRRFAGAVGVHHG